MLYLFDDNRVKAEYDQYRRKKFTPRLTLRGQIHDPVAYYVYVRFNRVCYGDLPTVLEDEALGYLIQLYEEVMGAPDLGWRDAGPQPLPGARRSLYGLLELVERNLQGAEVELRLRSRILLEFLEADLINLASSHDRELSPQDKDEVYLINGRIYELLTEHGLTERDADRTMRRIEGEYTPAAIKAYLDEYVIGQEHAKKVIATAVYGHMLRIQHPDTPFPSNVVLMIGPSGCGKTEIMRHVREITQLPMVFTDISSLGEAQYRGRHMEDVLLALWEDAGRDIERAQRGIVFMDEFDKLLVTVYSSDGSNKSDAVQSQLLTTLEGTTVELRRGEEMIVMDTSHILFILAGAFHGIGDYIRKDQLKKSRTAGSIGFQGRLSKDMDTRITAENINHGVLIDYGMKRELAGRIGNIAVLERLTEEELVRILTTAKDSLLTRYQREVRLIDGAELVVSEEVIRGIASEVREDETGARALYGKVRDLIRDTLYTLPDHRATRRIEIGKDGVRCI